MRVFVLAIALLGIIESAMAVDFSLGSGYSTFTSGRHHAVLYSALDFSSVGASAFSQGLGNSIYYQNAYNFQIYGVWRNNDFWWGKAIVMGGIGVQYNERGYKPGLDEQMERNGSFVTGPYFGVSWQFLGPVFLSVQSLFGIQLTTVLTMAAQHTSVVLLGVRI